MADPADEADAPAPPPAYACPTCGQAVAIAPMRDEQIVPCPSCGDEFTVPAAPAEIDDAEPADVELDGLRIRQLATARRAAYRARSYTIIAAGVCLVAAGQFLWHIRTSPPRQLVLAAAALVLFAWFARIAWRLHREAARTVAKEPTTLPDFSRLGDGSDAWKRLEEGTKQ